MANFCMNFLSPDCTLFLCLVSQCTIFCRICFCICLHPSPLPQKWNCPSLKSFTVILHLRRSSKMKKNINQLTIETSTILDLWQKNISFSTFSLIDKTNPCSTSVRHVCHISSYLYVFAPTSLLNLTQPRSQGLLRFQDGKVGVYWLSFYVARCGRASDECAPCGS